MKLNKLQHFSLVMGAIYGAIFLVSTLNQNPLAATLSVVGLVISAIPLFFPTS